MIDEIEVPAQIVSQAIFCDCYAQLQSATSPRSFMVALKGTLINFTSGDLHVNELKLDRARDLFDKGYTKRHSAETR